MSYIGNSSTLYDPTRNSPKTAQVLSGDGATLNFTLTYGVATSSDIQVLVENVIQQPDYAYTATGQLLSFTTPPGVGTNNIYVVYNRTAGLTGTVPDGSISSSKLANNIRLLATDQYVGTGVTTTYALSDTPADANSLIVTVNGIAQAAPINYTVASNIITFTAAPALNANVVIRNVGFRTSQTLYALGANTPIVQPVITGGSYTLAGALTATGNVSLLNASGATYTANIGGATGNLIIQSANNISVQVAGNTVATFTSTGLTANIANTNITGTITNNVNATLVTANTLNFYNGSSQIYAAGLGSGNQTWQNVTSSRVSGTTYTNSTGYPIVVSAFDIATVNISGYGSVTGTVNGVTLSFMKVDHATATDNNGTCVLIVPPGATYSVTWSGAYGTTYWYELR